MSDKSHMHAPRESDSGVVPANYSNNGGPPPAEDREGRPLTKENAGEPRTRRTQSRESVSQGLAGVRKAASQDRKQKFTALLHHVTVDLLRISYYSLKRRASAGVDGMTWEEYGTDLEARLKDLHGRVHRGRYQAKPSRRVYIPKADGRQRPLGIAALEDKVVQHAVVQVLNAIYEEDFKDFSYGFRPGRNQHQALDALSVGLMRLKVNYVLDCDIRGFFDNLSHEILMQFLQHRIADPRILRLIQKWLKAGVMEDGQWSDTTVGCPQGAVASPLLANIYLHYVFDCWVNYCRNRCARGDLLVIRFADDFVTGFQYKEEAEQFLGVLRERLAKFKLELHPDKTRLIEFGRYAEADRKRRGQGKPETFDFLGFTHICGRTRKQGWFQVQRKTVAKKLRAKLRELKQALRRRMHASIEEQGIWLKSVVQGHLNYYAVPGNFDSLKGFRTQLIRLWFRTLRKRSQRDKMNWARMGQLVRQWLPPARILHPYPDQRYAAIHPK